MPRIRVLRSKPLFPGRAVKCRAIAVILVFDRLAPSGAAVMFVYKMYELLTKCAAARMQWMKGRVVAWAERLGVQYGLA